jgi:hypothetical protein
MTDEIATVPALFEGGPPHRFESWVGLIRAGRPNVLPLALLVVALAWLPLAVLTALHGDFLRPDSANSFILDFAAHGRFLIAAPLLVLAEPICVPLLTAIGRQFLSAGLVAASDRGRYERAVTSTRTLINSAAAEVATVVLAYLVVIALFAAKAATSVPKWHGTLSAGTTALTPAGWWGLLVSLPILLILLLGWLWRICCWTRFLWLMARMGLRLIPSHPDRAAGLRFVGRSLEAFLPLGFIVGVIAAGPVLNQVVHQEVSPLRFKFVIVGVTVFTVALFVGPLLVFANRLIDEQRRGMFEYGSLAERLGEQFERKWLTTRKPLDKSALEVPDFSATTDLNSIAANVYQVRIAPIELRSLVLLVGATVLPFVPIALVAFPPSVILKEIADLLL